MPGAHFGRDRTGQSRRIGRQHRTRGFWISRSPAPRDDVRLPPGADPDRAERIANEIGCIYFKALALAKVAAAVAAVGTAAKRA